MKQKTCDGHKDPLMRSFEFTFSYILCKESVKFQTEISIIRQIEMNIIESSRTLNALLNHETCYFYIYVFAFICTHNN